MNLHEYQSKKLLKNYQIDVPYGQVIDSLIPEDIKKSLKDNKTFVFKSQIHAGGRGKSGGVKIVSSKNEVHEFAEKWLGKKPSYLSK